MSLGFKHVFNVYVDVDRPVEIGKVGAGQRRVIPITGSSFEGELLKV